MRRSFCLRCFRLCPRMTRQLAFNQDHILIFRLRGDQELKPTF